MPLITVKLKPQRYEQNKEREYSRRGVYFFVNDPRETQRDTVMRSIYDLNTVFFR